MRKIKDPSLFQSIRKFLTEDMPVIRKKSANTVEAYRYTLNLFLTFLGEKHNKSRKRLDLIAFLWYTIHTFNSINMEDKLWQNS